MKRAVIYSKICLHFFIQWWSFCQFKLPANLYTWHNCFSFVLSVILQNLKWKYSVCRCNFGTALHICVPLLMDISSDDTFALMFSYPLIIGRDYFIFSLWGLIVFSSRWHFGHELDSTLSNTLQAWTCFGMYVCPMNFQWALCKIQVMRSKQSKGYSLNSQFKVLITAKCVPLYHMIGLCACLLWFPSIF